MKIKTSTNIAQSEQFYKNFENKLNVHLSADTLPEYLENLLEFLSDIIDDLTEEEFKMLKELIQNIRSNIIQLDQFAIDLEEKFS